MVLLSLQQLDLETLRLFLQICEQMQEMLLAQEYALLRVEFAHLQ
jgi:hypothetical protein